MLESPVLLSLIIIINIINIYYSLLPRFLSVTKWIENTKSVNSFFIEFFFFFHWNHSSSIIIIVIIISSGIYLWWTFRGVHGYSIGQEDKIINDTLSGCKFFSFCACIMMLHTHMKGAKLELCCCSVVSSFWWNHWVLQFKYSVWNFPAIWKRMVTLSDFPLSD